jgi:hypothetical protein
MIIELKLSNGKVATWEGDTGEQAAIRYADAHRGQAVIAWRPAAHGLFIYNHNIRITE